MHASSGQDDTNSKDDLGMRDDVILNAKHMLISVWTKGCLSQEPMGSDILAVCKDLIRAKFCNSYNLCLGTEIHQYDTGLELHAGVT